MKSIALKNIEKKILKIIELLEKNYPAVCALNYSNAFQFVVAVILSAQCTDKRVNIVTADLFKKYKDISDFAGADFNELSNAIKSTGFYKNKANAIINCAKIIKEKYNYQIPDNLEELTKLPGIGRKSANVILSEIFNKAEGFVVDTHIKRLTYRIGLTLSNNVEKIERDMMAITPKKYWTILPHLLIWHGRAVCKARRPQCEICIISNFCAKKINVSSQSL